MTNNRIKFDYIKKYWELRNGVVYSKQTNNPIAFASKDKDGYRLQTIKVDSKSYPVRIHHAAQSYAPWGLQCKRSGNRLTTATMRQINKRDRLRYRCRH